MYGLTAAVVVAAVGLEVVVAAVAPDVELHAVARDANNAIVTAATAILNGRRSDVF
jgi:hypothetical protein